MSGSSMNGLLNGGEGVSTAASKMDVTSTMEPQASAMEALGLSTSAATLITRGQAALYKYLSQRPNGREEWNAFCESSGEKLVSALLDAANKVTSTPRVYLTIAEEFLAGRPQSRVPYFMKNGELQLGQFMRYLESSDIYTSGRAAMICAHLVGAAPRGMFVGGDSDTHQQFTTFLSWLTERLARVGRRNGYGEEKEGDGLSPSVALDACVVLLRNGEIREYFCSHPRATSLVVSLLNEKTNPQMLYGCVFCLWALSFSDHADASFADLEVAKKVSSVALSSSQDKVVRVGLATLRNLLNRSYGDCEFNEQMIDGDILKLLNELAVRPWTHEWDKEDVEADVKELNEHLQRNYRVMSSFERYKVELQSGQLTKGPVHTETFWKENAYRFEMKEFKLIKQLVSLLDNPESSPETLALACYDIGEFARFYDSGKVVLRTVGGKDKVMRLMTSNNPEVVKQALQASAKLLISNWEHVSSYA